MTNPCPEPKDPTKLAIDLGALGDAALIKKHEVRDDAEIVTMRDFKDVREGVALGASQMSCDQQAIVMENVFRYGGRTQQYRGCK